MKSVKCLTLTTALLCAIAAHAQTFNVFAAASLKESATEMAHSFEKKYPNFKVSLNFGGSQQLVAQIKQGAPVDILMSAGLEPLKTLDYEKGSLRIFATNSLTLIVPADSTKIQSLQDLSRGGRVILADRHVPVGHYTELVLANAAKDFGADWHTRVDRAVVSREQDVRAVLAKVSLGEADAGIVYITDVEAAHGKVRAIPIPDKYNVEAQYVAVRFAGSSNADLAKDFMRFLFEKEAQKALVNNGFGSPIVPGGYVTLHLGGQTIQLTPKNLAKLPKSSFNANEHGVMRKFTGYDLRPLLSRERRIPGKAGSIKMVAGDGYNQTVDLDSCLTDGFYLIETAHNNYQAILPNKIPRFWVHWVREITVQ